MQDLTELSGLIQRALSQKGLTQQALANACNIDKSYLSKIVNNKLDYPPSRETISSLARALEIDEYQLSLVAGYIPLSVKPLVFRFLLATGDRARDIMLSSIESHSD